MKHFFTLLLICVITISCSSNDESVIDNPIIGTWTLEKIVISDGVNISEAFIEEGELLYSFEENGTLTSNRSICILGVDGNSASGTFDLENQTISIDCGGTLNTLEYMLIENNTRLIFDRNCIEICREEFIKLE